MKPITKYLNSDVNESMFDAFKELTAATQKSAEEFIKIHKPTDTIQDYLNWSTDRVRKSIVQVFGDFFSQAQLNELSKQFVEGANKEIRSMGFKGNELFDDYIKAIMKKRK